MDTWKKRIWTCIAYFSPDTVERKKIVCYRDYEHGDTYRCIWQKTKVPEKWYVIYRVLHCALMLVFLLYSFFHVLIPCPPTEQATNHVICIGSRLQINYAWLFYLTRWGLILNFVQSIFGLYFVWTAYRDPPVLDESKPPTEHRFFSFTGIYWGIHSTVLANAFLIDVVYWARLHSYSDPINILIVNILVEHAFNFVFLLADGFIVAFPIYVIHLVPIQILGFSYTAVSYIYHQAGGFNWKHTQRYIYPFLNWEKPLVTLLHVVLFQVSCSIILLILMLLDFLKHKYYRRRRIKKEGTKVSIKEKSKSGEIHQLHDVVVDN